MANIISKISNKPIEELQKLSIDLIGASFTDKTNWLHWNNLTHYFNDAGDYDVAEVCGKKAMSLNTNEQTIYNMAIVYQNLNRHYKAIDLYRKLNPNNKMGQFNMSMSLLVEEQFEEGWKYYKHRLELFDKCKRMRERWKDTPPWNGENITKKKLVIFSEQGVGDVLQFCRFIPKIKAKSIVFEVQKLLLPLLDQLPCKVIGREDENWPEPSDDLVGDYCVSICDLAGILNNQYDGKPYLEAPSHLTIEPCDKLKIGFCFAGNSGHSKDWMRSCHLKNFEIIGNLDFVQLYCLQREVYEGTDWQSGANVTFIACGPYLKTFSDTASLLKKMDLLITVDTAIAHLAGALGVPCWLLLAIQPDWRWLLQGKTSKWYDSVTLYRQRKFMDWSDPFKEIKNDLIPFEQHRQAHNLNPKHNHQ
jgi:hypothetical protein